MSKLVQLGEHLDKPLRPSLKTALTFLKNVPEPLAKTLLIPLGLLAGKSVADAATQKKMYGPGCSSDLTLRTSALIISSEEMEDIMKKVQSLEELGSLMKPNTDTSKNETKNQKGRFISMLLVELAASILRNALAGKGVIRGSEEL